MLLDAIGHDLPDARVVLLGDLVDRGPDVRGAIRLARGVPDRFPGSEVLLGNHEDWFLRAVDGDPAARDDWLTWGGEATCRAYLVDPSRAAERLGPALRDHPDVAWLRARPRRLDGFGLAAGHLFVHAGIDPHAPLDDQDERDLIWMREPFLSWPYPLERVVVHGHTVSGRPQVRPHRIGIDTGAVFQGYLTALVLDGGPPRFLSATDDGVGPIEPERG